jgi:hypothetical protein
MINWGLGTWVAVAGLQESRTFCSNCFWLLLAAFRCLSVASSSGSLAMLQRTKLVIPVRRKKIAKWLLFSRHRHTASILAAFGAHARPREILRFPWVKVGRGRMSSGARVLYLGVYSCYFFHIFDAAQQTNLTLLGMIIVVKTFGDPRDIRVTMVLIFCFWFSLLVTVPFNVIEPDGSIHVSQSYHVANHWNPSRTPFPCSSLRGR